MLGFRRFVLRREKCYVRPFCGCKLLSKKPAIKKHSLIEILSLYRNKGEIQELIFRSETRNLLCWNFIFYISGIAVKKNIKKYNNKNNSLKSLLYSNRGVIKTGFPFRNQKTTGAGFYFPWLARNKLDYRVFFCFFRVGSSFSCWHSRTRFEVRTLG